MGRPGSSPFAVVGSVSRAARPHRARPAIPAGGTTARGWARSIHRVSARTTAAAPFSLRESAAIAPRLEVCVSEAPGELLVRIAGEAGVAQASEFAVALLRLSARRVPLG